MTIHDPDEHDQQDDVDEYGRVLAREAAHELRRVEAKRVSVNDGTRSSSARI